MPKRTDSSLRIPKIWQEIWNYPVKKLAFSSHTRIKKTRPVHKELGEGERDVCCDKKGLSSTSLSPPVAPIDYRHGYTVYIHLASIRSC